MLKGKILFTLLLGIAISCPFSSQARKPSVLVINTDPGQYGRCCGAFPAAKNPGTFYDALFKHLGGYSDGVDFKEIEHDVNRFDKELFSGKWDIFIVNYHGWQKSPDLQAWVKKNKTKIESWLRDGHGVISTGGRDPEDLPLVQLLGLGGADVATGIPTQCCINMLPNTPLSKGMEKVLDCSKSGSPSFFGDGTTHDRRKLPKDVEVAAVSPADDNIAAIVYGRFGNGGFIITGSAEVTNLEMGFGQPEMSKDSFTLWQNILNWFAEEGLAVSPSGKLSTSWGKIKTGY